MEFRIWIETRLDDRILERELVSRVERPACGVVPEEIGLTLDEGKAVLRKVQSRIVQTQVDVLGAAHRGCCHCGRNQRVKDLRYRTFRTVFGTIQVSCRRYFRCKCQGGSRSTVWPLHRQQLSGTSPELQYLYASWGSKVSYRRAASVLGELLPICDRGVSHATLRRHTLAIGGRLEREGRLGGYFAWVAQHPMCDAGAFMKAALDDHGFTQTSRVRVLADE